MNRLMCMEKTGKRRGEVSLIMAWAILWAALAVGSFGCAKKYKVSMTEIEYQRALAGKTDGVELDDLLKFGKFADLKTIETKAIISEIGAAVDRWSQFARDAEVPSAMAQKAKRGFRSF